MKKQSGFSSIIIISILLISISSAGLFYVLNKKNKAIKELEKKNAERDQVIQTQTDCGVNLDCFINASKEGLEAKVSIENKINLFGLTISGKNLMELTKKDINNKYGYRSTVLEASASLDDKIISILTNPSLTKAEREKEMSKYFGFGGLGTTTITDLGKPLTKEELNEAIKKQTEPYTKEQIGTQTICTYDERNKMTAILENWKAGNFSTEDLNFAKCEIKDKNGTATPLTTGPKILTPPTTKNPAGGTVTTTTTTTKETPPTETKKVSCVISEDCQTGYHCFKKECLSNTVLSKFSKCTPEACEQTPTGSSCSFNICTQPCTNCSNEKFACMLSSDEVKDKLCVECFMDLACKTGYTCKEYRCVK